MTLLLPTLQSVLRENRMLTKIISVDPLHLDVSENDIKNAAEIIIDGGLVAFPTETVYGLGGDGTNPEASRKIYAAKGRPSDNPLIIHIAHPADAEKYTYTNPTYYKLADRFMPGPLTVVMKAKDSVPLETRGGPARCASTLWRNSRAKRTFTASRISVRRGRCRR